MSAFWTNFNGERKPAAVAYSATWHTACKVLGCIYLDTKAFSNFLEV